MTANKFSRKKFSRRDLLKVAGVAAVTVVGLQVANESSASEPTPSGGRQWAMVIDQNKCTGCGYCVMACRAHNDVSPEITWNPVLESGQVGKKQVYLPRPCMQCAKAPCVDVCPVSASYHRPDGIVMMDYDRCIGCRYCEVACPYGARSFNWKAFDGPNPAVPEWGEPEVARRPRGVP
jgi:Fe-S-cluster-containing dehydrogenase component